MSSLSLFEMRHCNGILQFQQGYFGKLNFSAGAGHLDKTWSC